MDFIKTVMLINIAAKIGVGEKFCLAMLILCVVQYAIELISKELNKRDDRH